MARVELAPAVAHDLERILDHLTRYDVPNATARVEEIIGSIDILTHSPQIGRPLPSGLRELIIGRGSRGYVALYRYVAEADRVLVLAIRSQREARYAKA